MAGHMRKRGDDTWQQMVHVGVDRKGKERSASKTGRVPGHARRIDSARSSEHPMSECV